MKLLKEKESQMQNKELPKASKESSKTIEPSNGTEEDYEKLLKHIKKLELLWE